MLALPVKKKAVAVVVVAAAAKTCKIKEPSSTGRLFYLAENLSKDLADKQKFKICVNRRHRTLQSKSVDNAFVFSFGTQLLYKYLNMLAIVLVNYIDNFAGHASAQRFHNRGHIDTFNFGRKMRANLHPCIQQSDGDLHRGF